MNITLDTGKGSEKCGIAGVMKWFGRALVMFAAGLASAAPSDPMPLLAPLNPAFVRTQSLRATLQSAPPQVAPDGAGRGYIPSPIDRSHMIGLTPDTPVTPGAKAVMAAVIGSYPPSFDLRLSGHVTSVKDQGACGACWSFSAIASMESDTLMGNGGASDFSENHLNVRHAFDAAACAGGNGDMAGAYLTRWGNTGSFAAGPVYEFEDPYTSTAATSVAGLSPGVHLQEFLVLPDRAIGSGLDGTDNANYKYAIQNYGAVDVAIIADDAMVHGYSSLYWNQVNKALYYTDNGIAPFAHAAALVGWDDNYAATNFSTAPPGNGAFIVKNQWGSAWGNSGYFYISYYSLLIDAHVFRRPEGTSNYARSYLYDPFGQTSSYGYASDTAWGANVFTAVAGETLQAVAFNTTGVNTSYEISVYTGVSSTPSTGILEGAAVNTTGSFPYAGYHTVVLSRPVPVVAGQKFAVVVKFTTPGYTSPAPIEYRFPGYNSAASAGAGESFVSSNGTAWNDLGTLLPDANVNIRAFTAFNAPTTVPGAPTIGMATAGDASASVSFTPGAPGSGTLVNYTAVCGTVTATGTSSPIIVTGLTNGTDYNCRVRTTSTAGTSAWSAVSNTVSPRTLVDLTTLPVHRFANTQAGGHFYTIYESEKSAVLQNYSWFKYEGIGFFASTVPQPGMLPVYRFANTQAGGHFYTIHESEKNTVLQNYDWFKYEGIGFYASQVPQPGMQPVYRFANNLAGGHFYTISESEKNAVIQNYHWFRFEGIGFYAYPPQ